MSQTTCCVCAKTLDETTTFKIGDLTYCRTHYQAAKLAMQSTWQRSGLIEVLLSMVYVFGLGALFGETPYPQSALTITLFVVPPVIIWLIYIYRQDRLEPEPIPHVLGVTILGALLGWTCVYPIAENFISIDRWQHRSTEAKYVSAIAVIGLLSQLCTYLAVRFGAYWTDEFDEPTDGIVYATAGALGVSTAINVHFLLQYEAIIPVAAVTVIMMVVLIQVASAIPIGLGLGRLRFGLGSSLRMSILFLLSVLLCGLSTEQVFHYAIIDGILQPTYAIFICSGLLLTVLIVGGFILNRLQKRTIEGNLPRIKTTYRQDYLIFGIAAVFLSGGLVYGQRFISKPTVQTVLDDQVTITLPEGWVSSERDNIFQARPEQIAEIMPKIKIEKLDVQIPKNSSLAEQADLSLTNLTEQRRRDSNGFWLLETQEKQAFDGKPVMQNWFAMLVISKSSNGIPVVYQGTDIVVRVGKRNLYMISFVGPSSDWDQPKITRLLKDVRIGK